MTTTKPKRQRKHRSPRKQTEMDRALLMNGQTYGKMRVEAIERHGEITCICRCQCGNQKRIRPHRLLEGEVTDCGCSSPRKQNAWDVDGTDWLLEGRAAFDKGVTMPEMLEKLSAIGGSTAYRRESGILLVRGWLEAHDEFEQSVKVDEAVERLRRERWAGEEQAKLRLGKPHEIDAVL